MNKLTANFWIFILILFFGCNRHAEHDHSSENPKNQSKQSPTIKKVSDHSYRKPLDIDKTNELRNLLEINERLHKAFFEYAPQEIESLTKEMITAIDNISVPEISKRLNFSKQLLAKMKDSASREENNQNYHLVSMALIHLLNNFEIDEKYQAYSCPMVKMQWVQNTEKLSKVHNPFAPEMPHCGERQH